MHSLNILDETFVHAIAFYLSLIAHISGLHKKCQKGPYICFGAIFIPYHCISFSSSQLYSVGIACCKECGTHNQSSFLVMDV